MASRAATARVVAIVVGLVLALVAAFLLWRYVDAADQRAQEGAQLVEVFVAAGGIPEGMSSQTAVSQGLIEVDEIPSTNRPDTSVSNLEEISQLAAQAPIQQGAILQLGQWGQPTLADVDFEIEEGRVGVSLQVPIPQGVSGYLGPGDRVAVIAHITAPPETTSTQIDDEGNQIETTQDAEATETRSQYVASGATVLAIGQRVIVTDDQGNQDEAVEQREEQVLVTLSVTPDEAEKLVFASNEGLLSFAIQPDAGDLGDTPGRNFDNLFAP